MSRPGDRQARSRADVSPRSIGPWMPPAPCFASHTPFSRHVVTPLHHPPSFGPSDRTGAFQESVHCSRPVEGPSPCFSYEITTPVTLLPNSISCTPLSHGPHPSKVGRAWKVHHMIHLTGDIPHVTSDRARKGGRELRRPILPAPPPRFRPFKPLVQNDPPNWTKSRTFALRCVVDV